MDGVEVRVSLAARPASLPTLRAIAAQVARAAEATPELAVDLVIAVDEACSALIARARERATLACRFHADGTSVRFRAHVGTSAVTVPGHDSLYWRVVSSVTDAVTSWVDGDGLLHVELRCRG
ncbi:MULTISPECIES: ATP-binding protein [Actinosynnema]|uniref:ATP-binding protein n=1 Tax=Actinosynnema TaxID=40566 RepID=UPI0020A38D14|nr:ATP-binding protein [Actinosynnema pretiosum]MCP2098369.1 serine/threonine-protein kinase RsbW [Actinosynnema pretiosum]